MSQVSKTLETQPSELKILMSHTILNTHKVLYWYNKISYFLPISTCSSCNTKSSTGLTVPILCISICVAVGTLVKILLSSPVLSRSRELFSRLIFLFEIYCEPFARLEAAYERSWRFLERKELNAGTQAQIIPIPASATLRR